MSQITFAVVVTLTAQAIVAAVVGFLLFAFYRRYGKSYVLHWTCGWSAMAVHHLATVASLSLASNGATSLHPARIAAAITGSVASYLAIAWLLFGAYELVRRRPVRLLTERRILGLMGFAGAVISLLELKEPLLPDGRSAATTVIYGIVAAIAFFGAAVSLWKARVHSQGMGLFVLSGAFFVFAIEHLQYVALHFLQLSDRPFAVYLVHFEFLLQSILAIGMITSLLESEREAADLAVMEFEYLAYYDALTGLPNRPLFFDRLIVAMAQATRTSRRVAVLFVDLDRFKEINDSLGHSVGDGLLKTVAERLKKCVLETDTISRFGGDEFTLLLPQIDDADQAAAIARKVNDAVRAPYRIQGHELFVTASIGLSVYPDDGTTAEALVRNADTAMYRAKEQGRDTFHLYAPIMNTQALARLGLESTLRKALEHDEFTLHYQPIVDARSNVIVGVEALIRWHHPDHGFLLPGEFLTVAEESGMILPIGDWVLRTACTQIRKWREHVDFDMTMAVNLSARQFTQPDLVERVRSIIAETGADPGSIELEITESCAMQDGENAIRMLRELKAAGVRIAIDDFGTGYSSLNYLKRFPIDTIKLDQSFISGVSFDRNDAAIVGAVIAMAHSLNLRVVAEGVQTKEQLAFLQRQRCDLIQGYDFSIPLPAAELEPHLIEWRVATG